MQIIKLKDDECPRAGAGCLDWKATPMEVLKEIDAMLADVLYAQEIVIYETGDDSIVFTIENREED